MNFNKKKKEEQIAAFSPKCRRAESPMRHRSSAAILMLRIRETGILGRARQVQVTMQKMAG